MRTLEVILALIFPPIAVLIRRGPGKKFWLDCLLTLLGWFPGVVYALGLIAKPKNEMKATV